MYKDERLDRRIFKIMPFSRKLVSCPVCVHLAQFSYIDKTTFSCKNASSKLMCQPLCCRLIVSSLRFVNRNRLSDQCLVYNAKGYSGVDVGSTAQGAHQTRSQERKHVQYTSLVQVVKVVIQLVPVVPVVKQWLQVVRFVQVMIWYFSVK